MNTERKIKNLPIPLEDVVGLGRTGFIVFKDKDNNDKPIQLPPLHFIFYKDKGNNNEEGITGLCIEFGLFYWDKDQPAVQKNLVYLCQGHAENIIFGELNNNKENIIEVFFSKLMNIQAEPYWEVYRLINFRTALRGAPTVDNMQRSIMYMQGDYIHQLESRVRKLEFQLENPDSDPVSVTSSNSERTSSEKPNRNSVAVYDQSYEPAAQAS